MKNESDYNKERPQVFKDFHAWKLSRGDFIKGIISAGIASQLPFSVAATGIAKDKKGVLSEKQKTIVRAVQEILFPADGNGPGAKDIHAASYLEWVLSDAGKDPDEVGYIINGITWVDETAEELFERHFEELTPDEQDEVIAKVSKEGWGESWLSVMLTFIFEALLCDPKYGGNPESIGWQWLNHNPGQPRPSDDLLYPQILSTVRES